MKSGGYFSGPFGVSDNPGFREYWASHSGAENFAGWWQVRLARAGQSTVPTPREAIQAVRDLRARIDEVAEPDRTFTLAWLRSEVGGDVLISDEELVRLLQNLNREELVSLLRRRISSTDPDLQASAGNGAHEAMTLFILRHAEELLVPSDARGLLEQELLERDFQREGILNPIISPWWAIAAANLDDSDTAMTVLANAHARFRGQYDGAYRLELVEALLQTAGDEAIPVAVDWMYRELPSVLPTWGLSNTLERILRSDVAADVFLKAFVNDPRFDQLNWKSLEVLGRWTQAVSAQELESAWSPMGIDFFAKDVPAGMERYPQETSRLIERLNGWRRLIQARVGTQ
jgi:hypothetical protein